MKWRNERLGNILTLQRGYDLPQPERVDGEIPIVSSSGTTGFHNKHKAEGPGVVTGRYGTIGEVYFIKSNFWPLNTSLYVSNFNGNNIIYTYYLLKNALKNIKSDKAAVPGVNRNDLHDRTILYCSDIETQQSIAHILSAYDNLIENNLRRIALLEQSARLLYQEWFVRFQFPGHEKVKIVDGVPEGWRTERLGNVTTKIGSGATPRGGNSSYKDNGISLIRSQNIYDYTFVNEGLAFIDNTQATKLSNVIVEHGDLLLNITGASVGRCCIVIDRILPARVNQHVMIIRPNTTIIFPNYLLHTINSSSTKQSLLNIARAGGSTREALTKDVVSNLRIIIPNRACPSNIC